MANKIPLIKAKPVKTGKKPFDPEGMGYDYQSALKHEVKPDRTGHWPSRIPQSGLLFKGRKHPTWSKTIKVEEELGYSVIKVGPRYYSIK